MDQKNWIVNLETEPNLKKERKYRMTIQLMSFEIATIAKLLGAQFTVERLFSLVCGEKELKELEIG